MADQPSSVDSILCAAVEITSPDQRSAYLDEACGDDADLRAEVEKLLRAHFRAGSFLGRPVAGDRPKEVLDALTDSEAVPDALSPPPEDISLDFLEPCDVPGRLGKLGQYEMIDVIGRGGMGVVLRAYDPKLSRVVAVKVLAPEYAANATARKRFLREARAAAAVSHPHVVTIHAVEETDNTPYLVMECINGQSLQDKIERVGMLDLDEILRIGSQIAGGLDAAHDQGLVHRDVKTGNILLENDVERVKITDFGLARSVDDVSITRPGEVAGTPEFMSPEQAQGLAVDHRSDLFSLGCVLYAMCTGRPPFRANTTLAALRRVCEDTPRPIRKVNPKIPKELVAIIDRLLAKSPGERFQTAEEVADLLGRHLAYLQHPTKTPPSGPVADAPEVLARAEPGGKAQGLHPGSSQRGPWSVAVLVLLAVLTSLGVTEATGLTQFVASVIRIVTGEGILVVTVDDPAVSVTIEDQDVVITGAGPKEFRLTPGEYRLRAKKNGKPVSIEQELATITRGGREVVNVRLEPVPAAEAGRAKPRVAGPELRLEGPAGAKGWLPAGATEGEPPPLAVAPLSPEQAKQHQQAWADYLGLPVEWKNSLGMQFVLIPPGEFLMGSSAEEQTRFREKAMIVGFDKSSLDEWLPAEGPPHRVQISRPFYLGRHEVTQAQWEVVMGHNPSSFKSPANPVENVSWHDIQLFLKLHGAGKLGVSSSEMPLGAWEMTFTLPTEAQWEHACRAGTTTPFFFGDSGDKLDEYAWSYANSADKTHPVGQLKPNPWGLYDMCGNAWEWCADRYAPSYYVQSPPTDPVGPPAGSARILRGGCWGYAATYCRSAFRRGLPPGSRYYSLGFRLAAVLTGRK